MRVIFRVEGNLTIGLGHMMRCMALAQGLDKSGHDVAFIMSEASQQFCKSRADWVGDIHNLELSSNQPEPEYVKKQCLTQQADWLVLDGYQFTQHYRQSLNNSHFKLAIFDDINNSGALFTDLIINGAPNADSLNYGATAPHAELAIGEQYQVLRQEFLCALNCKWQQRTQLSIMFGGSDPQGLTLETLQALQSLEVPMPITVITGAVFSQLTDLNALIDSSTLNITHLHDCQNLAPIFSHSRLIISAAGGTQFELLACNTPAILVVVADNQLIASQSAASQGWCEINNYESSSPMDWAKQCLELWQSSETLLKWHQKAQQFPVIDGANNIAKLMSQLSENPKANL